MKKFSIKVRIMLWYLVLLTVLLGILIPFLYYFMKASMYDNAESLLRIHTSQALANFEFEDEKISLENFRSISSSEFILYDVDDSPILDTGSNEQLYGTSANFDKVSTVETTDGNWLIFDQMLMEDEEYVGWLRGYSSLDPIENTLKNLRMLIFIAFPIYIIVAITGGLIISGKALAPVAKITETAKLISDGNLSERIGELNTNDEVSDLANTFDHMIDKLESSIIKEKRFTANASHELRTPISVIMANAEDMLAGEHSMSEHNKVFELILQETKKMKNMVAQLLMLSRGDELKYKYSFERINMALLVEDILDEMKAKAEEKEITIDYHYKENCIIEADQTLMVRMVLNLVDNAIKYGKQKGNINITLEKNGKQIEFKIGDNGIGISKEDMPLIFNRFYRADSSRNSEGSGLGLSIVKWIVEVHKGKIEIESELLKGTIITILLPIGK